MAAVYGRRCPPWKGRHRGALRQPVDDLALAFIAPLCADERRRSSITTPRPSERARCARCAGLRLLLHRAARRRPLRRVHRDSATKRSNCDRRPSGAAIVHLFARHCPTLRQVAAGQREARGRSRTTERATDAVVAAAATAVDDLAALAFGKHRERGAGVVVIAAQVGQVDVNGGHAVGGAREVRQLIERGGDIRQRRQKIARGGERRCGSRQTRQRTQRAARSPLRSPCTEGVFVAQRGEQIGIVAFAGAIQSGRACECRRSDVTQVQMQAAR